MYRSLVLLLFLLLTSARAWSDSIVDVRTCPGVAGDGKTDDGQAIQDCMNANPAKRILFPSQYRQPGKPDYFVKEKTLTLHGNDQWIEGEGGGRSGRRSSS